MVRRKVECVPELPILCAPLMKLFTQPHATRPRDGCSVLGLFVPEDWGAAGATTLTASPMTDDEFAEFCAEHSDYFIEMTADGEILIMPPNYSLTGVQNAEIVGQLREWARRQGAGVVTDGSSGFALPTARGVPRTPHG
jgi:hypothetical protein